MREPLRILIVEDHADSAEALCRIFKLRIPGCVCILAGDLEDGLTKAKTANADITILDLGLPKSRDYHHVIESIPEFPPPVIVITDLPDEDSAIELKCYAYQAQNFFSKTELRQTIILNEGAELIKSITKAHYRHVLPKRRERLEAKDDDGADS